MQEDKTLHSYKELIVWQKSMDLAVKIYALTAKYPASELYGLTSQTRRSAVSIPSNIAEGRLRGSRKDFHHFLLISYASAGELETQLLLAKRLSLGKEPAFTEVDGLLLEVMKMLNKMLSSLRSWTRHPS